MGKLTASIPDDLHQLLRDELLAKGVTLGQLMEQIVQEHYTQKKGSNDMGNKTLALQISEELFDRIKAYLKQYEETHHVKLTQRDFVIGLIETALAESESAEDAPCQIEEAKPDNIITMG